ncbi:MAG: hypothetical protein WAK48_01430 [Candidatus Acidiferrum sp.]|jgi:hypothetical protein
MSSPVVTPGSGLPLLRLGRLVAFTSLVATMVGVPVVRAQSLLNRDSAPVVLSNDRAEGTLRATDVIARTIERNRERNEHLQNYSAVRTYEVLDLDGRVSAQAVVGVNYQAPGTKTFQRMTEDGSWIIRRVVFDRLLQVEEDTSSGQERRESLISEENYNFEIVGEADLGTHHCYVVAAQPKKLDKYLFVGRIWIDAQDFGIAKISGRPAAKLSFWITSANFVREYRRIDGFWLPYQDRSIVDLKVHGTKVFQIEHRQYVINNLRDPRAVPSHTAETASGF